MTARLVFAASALTVLALSSHAHAADRPQQVGCTTALRPSSIAGMPGTLRLVEQLTIPPGADGHRHRHDMDELVTVLSGTGTLSIDGKPDVALKPGVVVEVRPGVRHQHHNGSDTEPLVFTATFLGKDGAHDLTRYVGEKDVTSGCPHQLKGK